MKLRHLSAVVFVSLAVWAAVIVGGVYTYGALVEDAATPTTGITQGNQFTVQWTWNEGTQSWTADPICTDAGVWHWRTSHQEWTLDQTTEAQATCKL